MVVDDRPANLIAMRAVLSPLAVDVVEASSGEEALEAVATSTFAVALIDVQMPGMDGFQLATRLRQTPNWKRSCRSCSCRPYIVMSATCRRAMRLVLPTT